MSTPPKSSVRAALRRLGDVGGEHARLQPVAGVVGQAQRVVEVVVRA